jgi:putative transposase
MQRRLTTFDDTPTTCQSTPAILVNLRCISTEGSTENATLVTGLLVDLRERGLDVTRPMLVGLDGSKALRKAVLDVLDHPVIQRCQLHKIRNVKDHVPQRLRSSVGRKMTDAYHASSALEAEAALLALAGELDRTHPGAAASLREGLHDTLTVLRSTFHPRWPAPCARRTASNR